MESQTATTCPVTQFREMREKGPVIEAPGLGAGTTFIVTGHDDVRAMLTDPRLRADGSTVPGAESLLPDLMERIGIPPDLDMLSHGLLTRDGADHARLRKLVSRAFTVRRVGELRPRVEALTAGLLDDVAAAGTDGRPVDLIPAFTYALPVAVICELVGVPEHLRAPWREMAGLLVAFTPDRVPDVARTVVAQLRDLIAERRREPADDLLTALVEAHDEGAAERSEGHPSAARAAMDPDRLTEDEIVILVFDVLVAGFETTAHLMAKSIQALLTRPDQLAALRADPDLWPTAVHELVRLCGPIPTSLPRYASADMEIAGHPVPRGAGLMASLLSANTDPAAFDRPEELDIRRPTGRGEGHVGFGQGPHYCLGAALARQETEVALRALFERFDDLRLDAEGDVPPSELGFARLPELMVRTEL